MKCITFDTKVFRNLTTPSPNLKKIVDISTTQVYYYLCKLSNFPELITHLPLYNVVRIISSRKNPCGELPRENSASSNSTTENFPSGFNEDSRFTAIFPAINHWFGAAAVRTGNDFSIIYIFIIIFMNRVYSKVNNFSNFLFHCQKSKLGILRSVFRFSSVRKQSKSYLI